MDICIIPARGGSKGILKKNIKTLNGQPLIYWTIKAAIESNCFDDVIISTDDADIVSVSNKFDVKIHHRSAKNSTDNVHSIFAILECIDWLEKTKYSCNSISMLLPTSPLRKSEDIVEAFSIFKTNDCDSVVSVVKYDKVLSSIRAMDDDYLFPVVETNSFEKQRQDINQLYEVNGSIFISTSKNLKKTKSFHKGNVKPYIMSKLRSIDINSLEDFIIAENIMKYETTI